MSDALVGVVNARLKVGVGLLTAGGGAGGCGVCVWLVYHDLASYSYVSSYNYIRFPTENSVTKHIYVHVISCS